MRFHPRHIGKVENRNPLRGNVCNFIQRPLESFRRLQRQAVDKIYIDAFDPKFTGPCNDSFGQFLRLDAIDCLLNMLVEILHSQAEPVCTSGNKCFQMFKRQLARIQLDAGLHARVLAEALAAEVSHRREQQASGTAPPPQLPPAAGGPRNPYKGLRPFTEADAGDFFGRSAFVQTLLEAVNGGWSMS